MTQIRKEQAYVLRAYWTKISNIAASSMNPSNTLNITTQIAASSITNLSTGDVTPSAPVRGIVTNPSQPNFVKIRSSTTHAPIVDTVSGEVVYGRITHIGPGPYNLSFYYLAVGGSAVPATFALTNIDILIPEVLYNHEVRPDSSIVDEGGFSSTTLLSANTQGWGSVLAVSPQTGAHNPQIDIGQQIQFPSGSSTYFIDNNSSTGLRISGTNSGSNSDNIKIVTAQTVSTNSGSVDILSGDVTTSGIAGNINVKTGKSALNSDGGNINITTQDVISGSGETGFVNIYTGNGSEDGSTGNVVISSGDQYNVSNSGALPGQVCLFGGSKSYAGGVSSGAAVNVYGGCVGSSKPRGGDAYITAGAADPGSASGGFGGNVVLYGGDGYLDGGAINIITGDSATGLSGKILMSTGTPGTNSGNIDIHTEASPVTSGNIDIYTMSGGSTTGNISIQTAFRNFGSAGTINVMAGGIGGPHAPSTSPNLGNVNLYAAYGSNGVGGDGYFVAGDSTGVAAKGGNIHIKSGAAVSANAGQVDIVGGSAGGSNKGGNINVVAGKSVGAGLGGTVTIYGGDTAGGSTGGGIDIYAGNDLTGLLPAHINILNGIYMSPKQNATGTTPFFKMNYSTVYMCGSSDPGDYAGFIQVSNNDAAIVAPSLSTTGGGVLVSSGGGTSGPGGTVTIASAGGNGSGNIFVHSADIFGSSTADAGAITIVGGNQGNQTSQTARPSEIWIKAGNKDYFGAKGRGAAIALDPGGPSVLLSGPPRVDGGMAYITGGDTTSTTYDGYGGSVWIGGGNGQVEGGEVYIVGGTSLGTPGIYNHVSLNSGTNRFIVHQFGMELSHLAVIPTADPTTPNNGYLYVQGGRLFFRSAVAGIVTLA